MFFQAMNSSSLHKTCSDSEMGKLIGNAMSVNVVERVLLSLFTIVGILPNSSVDRWKSMSIESIFGIASSNTIVSADSNTPVSAFDADGHAAASRRPYCIQSSDTKCIVDTGASEHIISRKDLSPSELRTIRKSEYKVDFQIANDLTSSDTIVDIYIQDFYLYVTAWVFEDSPPLVSAGKLVEDYDAKFSWSLAEGPLLRIGDKVIQCQTKARCPFVAVSLGNPGHVVSNTLVFAPQPKAKPQPILKRRAPKLNEADVRAKFLAANPPKKDAADVSNTPVSAPPPRPPLPQEKRKKESPLTRELKKKRATVRSKHISSKFNCHNVFTHFPKCVDCQVCQATNTSRAQCRIKGEAKLDDLPEPKAFADRITFDHFVLNEDDGEVIQIGGKTKVGLVIQDAFTKWLASCPSQTKAAEEVALQIQRYLGPTFKAKHTYSDNAKEFVKAMQDMGVVHDTSTPNRSETNGVIERAVRRLREGTSACLVQSGLNEEWWEYATECYCALRNVVDLLIDGETAWKKRFGIDFTGSSIPFGAEVLYKPSSKEGFKRVEEFGNKLLAGIFVGYVFHAGGGWTADILVVDQEEINVANNRSECKPKRIK